jgi:hypothetical protein
MRVITTPQHAARHSNRAILRVDSTRIRIDACVFKVYIFNMIFFSRHNQSDKETFHKTEVM